MRIFLFLISVVALNGNPIISGINAEVNIDGETVAEADVKSALGQFGLDLVTSSDQIGEAEVPKKLSIPYSVIKQPQLANSALNFIRQYGYLEVAMEKSEEELETTGAIVGEDVVMKAIRRFQRRNGLPVTGMLDRRTAKLMGRSRCGVKDVSYGSDGFDLPHSRGKRYTLSRRKWGSKTLYYWLDPQNITKDMEEVTVKKEIERGLELWAGSSDISFVETNNKDTAEIKMSFVVGDHGDGYPFTGLGGSLAHAFYPTRGLLHFDDAERFTAGTIDGTNLHFTATHEMGHILGIKHSTIRGAVMYPYYPGYSDKLALQPDDIKAIQKKHGKGKGTVTPLDKDNGPTEPPRPLPTPDQTTPPKCIQKIDGAFKFDYQDPFDPMVFVFAGQWYYKLKPKDFAKNNFLPILDQSTEPKKISAVFKGVPNNIDAAIEGIGDNFNKVYFFKGDRMYIFDFSKGKVINDKTTLKDLWPQNTPTKIDGAFKINSKTLGFLDGKNLYKYSTKSNFYTGPENDYFGLKNTTNLHSTTITFFRVWTWIFQGNWYTVAKATNGYKAPGYEFRPIVNDIKLPMCSEGVGALYGKALKGCKKELKKMKKKKLRGFEPSPRCRDYIQARLSENKTPLSD